MKPDKSSRIYDCWINSHVHDHDQLSDRIGYLFADAKDRLNLERKAAPVIAAMDRAGIDFGLLTVDADDPGPELRIIAEYPHRLAGAVKVDPHSGMRGIAQLQEIVASNPIKAVRVSAHEVQEPYDHRIYYPVYAKCAELGLPITANVGVPGPRVPSKHQHPMALDEVAWFFPELSIVMTHGGEPWQDLCVKLMLKWQNLFMMTSAFAPKYYPPELIDYANSRGRQKLMFASGYPMLDFKRCVDELDLLDLREESRVPFLFENAERVFGLDSK